MLRIKVYLLGHLITNVFERDLIFKKLMFATMFKHWFEDLQTSSISQIILKLNLIYLNYFVTTNLINKIVSLKMKKHYSLKESSFFGQKVETSKNNESNCLFYSELTILVFSTACVFTLISRANLINLKGYSPGFLVIRHPKFPWFQ